MKRSALCFFAALLIGCFTVPFFSSGNPAYAGDRVEAGDQYKGGGDAETGEGDDGPGGYNDVRFNRGRYLNWDRDWSWQLMNKKDPITKMADYSWCGDEDNKYRKGVPETSYLNIETQAKVLAQVFLGAIPRAPGQTWGWDDAGAFARTATCLSPAVKWTARKSGFRHAHKWSGEDSPLNNFGLDPDKALYEAVGESAEKKNVDCSSPSGAGNIAFCILRDEVAKDVGIQNECRVRSDVAIEAKANKSGCVKNLQKMIGLGSESEQIPKNPSSIDDVRIPGVPNTAIVRVWRECPHTFSISGPGEEYEPLKSYDATPSELSDCKRPIIERVIPRVTEGPLECPKGPTPEAPYKAGALIKRFDPYCKGPFYNYFYTDRSPNGLTGWLSSASSSDGAFGSQGPRSARDAKSFADPVAGALFGKCQSPPPGQPRGNTEFCLDYIESGAGKVGTPEPGASAPLGKDKNGNPEDFSSRCENGPISQGKPWRTAEYLGQLALLAARAQKTNSMVKSGKATAAFNFGWYRSIKSKTPAPEEQAAQNEKAIEAFIRLFIANNPMLYNYAKNVLKVDPSKLEEIGLHPSFPANGERLRKENGKWVNSDGWLPWENGLDQIKFTGAVQKRLDRLKSDDERKRYVSCLVFNDWMHINWEVGGGGKKSVSSVSVAMNPRPNQMYLVQIVILDSRENILSESLQFAASPASGKLPSLTPTTTEWDECENAMDKALGRNPIRKHAYPKGGSKPPECFADPTNNPITYPLPKPTNLDSEQPLSQMTGQSWAFGQEARLGRFDLDVSGVSSGTAPGGSPGSSGQVAGVWLPRAIRATIYNREDRVGGDSQERYLRSHRIRALSDSSEAETESRFKMVDRNPSGGYLKSNNIPTDGSKWLQARLPLMYAPEGSLRNSFYNEWAVGVSNPTRTPDEDLDSRAKQLAGGDAAWAGLDATSKEQYRDEAQLIRKREVDEHRLLTSIGEASSVQSTSVNQICPRSSSEPCVETGVIKHEWRRLTADRCPGPGDVHGDPRSTRGDSPGVSVEGGPSGPCNPDTPVGYGWKVSDAYFLPSMGAQRKTELAAPFRVDEDTKEYPAHFTLDAPDDLKSKISSIAIWDRSEFANRTGESKPLYQLQGGNSATLSACKKEERIPKIVYDDDPELLKELPHRYFGWTQRVGDGFALPGTDPSQMSWADAEKYVADNGAFFDGGYWGGGGLGSPDGAFVSGDGGFSDFFGRPASSTSEAAAHAGGYHYAFYSSENPPNISMDNVAYFRLTDTGWKLRKRVATKSGGGSVTFYDAPLDSSGRPVGGSPRWQYMARSDGYAELRINEWGQNWWYQFPFDTGDWEAWAIKKVPREIDINPYTGKCTDEHALVQNMVDNYAPAEGQEGYYKPESLPAGDYVVSFTIIGPTSEVSRWGIDAKTGQQEGTKWVSSFNLDQADSLTSIYRSRPTG